MTSLVVQLWCCAHCAQTYPSPVVLAHAPTHHCPSLRAIRVRPYTLQERSGQ